MSNSYEWSEFRRQMRANKERQRERTAFRIACAGLAVLLILNLLGV